MTNSLQQFYRADNGWSGCDGWVTILDAANDLSKPSFSGPGGERGKKAIN